MDIQWLAKVFTPLELFHILSCYNHKCKCILMGFYVIDQHKVVNYCEVQWGKMIHWQMFLIILREILSWRAHLLITNSRMFISSSSLAFFLPPPDSLALLLSSDRRWSSVWFFRLSLTLLGLTEKRLMSCLIFYFFLLHRSHGDHQCDIDWQKANTTREKGEEDHVTSSSLIYLWFIWNRQLFIQIYTCIRV